MEQRLQAIIYASVVPFLEILIIPPTRLAENSCIKKIVPKNQQALFTSYKQRRPLTVSLELVQTVLLFVYDS